MNPADTLASPAADVQATIEELWVYPVKSCAGIPLRESELTDTGLLYDRAWMVVDAEGEFVSQRELPRMALIQPSFKMGQLMLRAPGMLSLHLGLDVAEGPLKVRVWDDAVDAYDMGDVAAQWFSDFLGPDAPAHLKRLRLARFDPDVKRPCDPAWTGGREATTQFADGFGLLVTSNASLADLQGRIARTIAFVQGFDAARFAGSEERVIELKIRGETVHISGLDYLTKMALPNFFFHITIAYALLRANGAPIGKMDFLGGAR